MIKSFKVGDVLSESSHYKVLADNGNLNFKLKHLESGDINNVRPVNINTIKWIILGGTKYVVE